MSKKLETEKNISDKSDRSDMLDKYISKSSQYGILPKPHNVKNLSDLSDLSYLSDFKKKIAFTLAEVLITLGIIGVVAALVLPGFMQDMAERINSHRQANIAQKITKSVELMTVNGDYKNVSNTEEFVNILSKYLKIAKVCDNDHLTDCWPTKQVKTADNQRVNVEDFKTGRNLHTPATTDNVGVILADGASLIMTFNPEFADISGEGGFIPSKKSLPIGGGKTEEFAYTSNATAAIDFVMDVNGSAGPNSEPKDNEFFDIRSFRFASFSSAACAGGYRVNGICIVELGNNYKPMNCFNNDSTFCQPNVNYMVDYWAGARKACDDMDLRLPTYSEIISLNSSSGLKLNFLSYMLGNTHTSVVKKYQLPSSPTNSWNDRSIQAPVLCISK